MTASKAKTSKATKSSKSPSDPTRTISGTKSQIAQRLLANPAEFLRFLYPEHEFRPFHCQWLELVANNRLTLILAPRGHAKTTVVTISEIVRRLLADRDCRILLASNTQDQARAIYRTVRELLQKQITPCGLFGDPIERSIINELWLTKRKKIHKEASLTALGVFGALTLRHFDQIFVDDALDFENTRSATQRKKFREWVGMTLLPTLEPGGHIHWVGTRYHNQDFYGAELLDQARYPTLVWNQGSHRALLEDGGALWPERFSVQELEQIRQQVGSTIFAAQYLNDTQFMRGTIFREQWFRYFHEPPQDPAIYIGFDPAISQSEQADYSALAVVGRTGQDLYVLEAYKGRWTFDEQLRLLALAAQKWRPLTIGIEDVAYQRALIETCRNNGLPVVAVPRRTDKVSRAYVMQGLFESGRIYFPAAGRLHELEAELTAFPEGEHDDLFDALETAIGQAQRPHVGIILI
ncbi:MAG: phage terminase large subunit [Candidatus Alcyoniella australis]|nr:phage terminase large subunit [Candidatus Alcyoniella australis]